MLLRTVSRARQPNLKPGFNRVFPNSKHVNINPNLIKPRFQIWLSSPTYNPQPDALTLQPLAAVVGFPNPLTPFVGSGCTRTYELRGEGTLGL